MKYENNFLSNIYTNNNNKYIDTDTIVQIDTDNIDLDLESVYLDLYLEREINLDSNIVTNLDLDINNDVNNIDNSVDNNTSINIDDQVANIVETNSIEINSCFAINEDVPPTKSYLIILF